MSSAWLQAAEAGQRRPRAGQEGEQRGLSAMRATYVPAPAAVVGVERLVVTAPAGLVGDGELTLYLTGHRRLRAVLPAGQLRDVLRRWAAAARAGLGELEIGE
jgi:hypothetical protein